MLLGKVSEEIEVKVPPSEAWELYGSTRLAKVVCEALSTIVSKIEVVEGDGAPGTILHIFLLPGAMGELRSYKEKYTVVDNQKRVKETEAVEGGYLDLGFTLYRIRFEVMEKEGNENECVTRTTVEYELKEEFAENAAAALVSIQPFIAIMQTAAHNLHQNHNIK